MIRPPQTAAIPPSRSWFESWRRPCDFFRTARHAEASIPPDKAIPQHLRDAYVVGLFAEIWDDHRRCEVRLVPTSDRFPDAQLRENNAPQGFEITIADKRDRRMFAEHRNWAEMAKRGQYPPAEDMETRQEHMREAIPRVCQEKVQRYFGAPHSDRSAQANLLIYVNLGPDLAKPGPILSAEEMVQLTAPWGQNFASVWLLCGLEAYRTWPAFEVLRPIHDPFGN